MMRTRWFLLVIALAASGCGKLLGIEDLGSSTSDANRDGPAPPTDVMPGNVTFRGQVFLFDPNLGNMPVVGAVVDVLEAQTGTVLGSAISNADGSFDVSWFQSGTVDVFVFGKDPQRVGLDTFLYFATLQEPGMHDASFTMFTMPGLQQMAQMVGIGLDPSLGTVLAFVGDQAEQPVANAVVRSAPAGRVFYSDETGAPSTELQATSTAGIAWIFNAPPTTDVSVLPPPPLNGTNYVLDVPPTSVSFLPLQLP